MVKQAQTFVKSDARKNHKPLENALTFIDSFDTVIMATVSSDGQPEASYAPYYFDHQFFYIFISELSQHTQNLNHCHECSLLFIEPENQADNLFARKRLSIQSSASLVSPETDLRQQTLALMKDKFGEIMTTLSQLPDFHLFKIAPKNANFVGGFANAQKFNFGKMLRESKEK